MDPQNEENLFSILGHVIYFMGVPATWCSKLRSRIALSSAEAEHASLSLCLRDVVLIMSLIN